MVMRVAASASVRAIARRSEPGFVSFSKSSLPKRGKHTHDISLRTNSNKTIDVLADRYQHLSSHMSALLGSRSLILNMNTSSSLLNKQFCQLHNGSQSSMSGISICDDGAEVVDVGELGAVDFRFGRHTLFSLLAVVEELSHEEMADFVWHGGLKG